MGLTPVFTVSGLSLARAVSSMVGFPIPGDVTGAVDLMRFSTALPDDDEAGRACPVLRARLPCQS